LRGNDGCGDFLRVHQFWGAEDMFDKDDLLNYLKGLLNS